MIQVLPFTSPIIVLISASFGFGLLLSIIAIGASTNLPIFLPRKSKTASTVFTFSGLRINLKSLLDLDKKNRDLIQNKEKIVI